MTETALPSAPAPARSPKAARQSSPRWLDGRVVGGVLLVLLAVVIGYTVVNGAQKTTGYLAVDAGLEQGHVITDGDLTVVQVRLGSTATRYLGAGQRGSVVGRVVLRPLAAGELLPADATGAGTDQPERVVSFPVSTSRAVAGTLRRGDLVDVLATYTQPPPGSTSVIAQSVEIVSVETAGGGLAGGGDGIIITVNLQPDQVVAFTFASQTAQLDVVRVVPDKNGQSGSLSAAPVTGSASPTPAAAKPAAASAPASPAAS